MNFSKFQRLSISTYVEYGTNSREPSPIVSNIEQAAIYIQDAMDGIIRAPLKATKISRAAFKLHLAMYYVVNTSALVLVALTFFERPLWCANDEDPLATRCDCSWIPPVDEISSSACPYPTFDISYLSKDASMFIEFAALFFIAFDALLVNIAYGVNIFTWHFLDAFFALALFADTLVASLCTGHKWRLAPYLRLCIFMMYSIDIRSQFRLIFRIIPGYLRISSLIFLMTLFFGWFGTVLFPDSITGVTNSEGDLYFPNLEEALYNLLILISTANYPDVMIPVYTENRWSCLFFVAFLLMGFFFMMNLLLATVINTYTEEQTRGAVAAQQIREENLTRAFEILDVHSDGTSKDWIEASIIKMIFSELNNFKEIHHIDSDTSALLFAALDNAGDNRIHKKEFQMICSVLQMRFEKLDEPTFVERWIPSVAKSDSFAAFKRLIRSIQFEYFIDVLLVLNAGVIGIQTQKQLAGVWVDDAINDGSIDTIWEVLETLFTAIYVLEMLSKMAVYGMEKYTREYRNIFDAFITVTSLVASIYVYYPNAYNDTRLIRYVLMVRLLRLVRLIVAIPEFQVIGDTFVKMLPAALKLLKVLFCVMYIYAALGLQIFGGLINTDPNSTQWAKLVPTDYYASGYAPINFNDMEAGFVLLFCLLVVNNWFVVVEGFVAVTSKSARLYFISFYLIGVLIIVNIVIAFIIDTFVSEREEIRSNKEDVDLSGEAMLVHGDAAEFDAAFVTGTRTGLHGKYRAVVQTSGNATQHGSSKEQQAMLRGAFTKSMSIDDNL